MTKSGILVPTCANVPWTTCGLTKDLFSAVLDGCKHVPIPWHRKQSGSIAVQPLEIISFWTDPGPGSEWASFGLARYPAEIEVPYHPNDDDRFTRTITKGGMTRWEFDWKRWQCWLQDNGHDRWEHPDDEKFRQQRKVKTGLGSTWRYSSFCKTQYASDDQCGGIPNFIRCHLCVIHLLDRIGKLPTMKVEIDDEGKYGRSYYTDDPWAKKRVYTWHDGKYDVKALVEEVGSWNEMIAATSGCNQRHAQSERIICSTWIHQLPSFPDFEQLEFKGQKNHQYLAPFLKAMKQLADQQREATQMIRVQRNCSAQERSEWRTVLCRQVHGGQRRDAWHCFRCSPSRCCVQSAAAAQRRHCLRLQFVPGGSIRKAATGGHRAMGGEEDRK